MSYSVIVFHCTFHFPAQVACHVLFSGWPILTYMFANGLPWPWSQQSIVCSLRSWFACLRYYVSFYFPMWI